MDKYQKFILGNIFENAVCEYAGDEEARNINYIQQNGKQDSITIKQDDDITRTDYVIVFKYIAIRAIKSISVLKGASWENVPFDVDCETIKVPVSFKNKTDNIKFAFKDDLADEYIISIDLIDSDKYAYYAKKKEEDYKALIANAKIKHSTGNSILNIYFQPCCDSYVKTNIKLYVPDTYERVPSPYGPYDKPKTWNMIKNINVAEEDFFVAIPNLAYGTYSYVLTQFAADGSVLIKTEHIEVKLNHPPVGNGKHTVVI